MGCCMGVPVPSPAPAPLEPRVTMLESTALTCTTDALQRKHVFDIKGYRSLLIRVAPGNLIRSATFEVGGVDWVVNYYPHGDRPRLKPGVASFSVDLMTPGVKELASCEFSVVPWSATAGGAPLLVARTAPMLFDVAGSSSATATSGSFPFVRRMVLETPAYLHDDTIRIECAVTVYKLPGASVLRPPPTPEETKPPPPAPEEPPTELSSYFAKLLDPNAGAPAADAYFHVGNESSAHRFVLWARCRKLYDRTKAWPVVVIPKSEVDPATFKALLHYIYTDSLPAMDHLSSDRKAKMLKNLLASADIYEMEKLKLACQKGLRG